MTGNVVNLSIFALGYLPERYVLGEVDRLINTYFFHFDFANETMKLKLGTTTPLH